MKPIQILQPQYVWILSLANETVDCAGLCKMVGIKTGIFTIKSRKIPKWLKEALLEVEWLSRIALADEDNDEFELVSFPESIATSQSLLMPEIKYADRIKGKCWLNPESAAVFNGLSQAYMLLGGATEKLWSASLLHPSAMTYIENPVSAKVPSEKISEMLRPIYDQLINDAESGMAKLLEKMREKFSGRR